MSKWRLKPLRRKSLTGSLDLPSGQGIGSCPLPQLMET
jgi:hypothetical protein